MIRSVCLSALTGLASICAFAGDKDLAATTTPQDRKRPPKESQRPLKMPLPLYETFDNNGPTNLGVRADILYMVYNSPVLTYASEQETTAAILHSNILNVPGKLSLGCNLALMYTMPNQPGYSLPRKPHKNILMPVLKK